MTTLAALAILGWALALVGIFLVLMLAAGLDWYKRDAAAERGRAERAEERLERRPSGKGRWS